MVFKANDPNINRAGRPTIQDKLQKMTKRELKDRELLLLLRKIRPHVAESIMQAARIMKAESASHQNQLKAATILLDNYRKLVMDLYDGEDEGEEGEEVQQQNAPVFSLKVVDTSDEE